MITISDLSNSSIYLFLLFVNTLIVSFEKFFYVLIRKVNSSKSLKVSFTLFISIKNGG